jgi:beta-phosphoglucomutase family hydrolase
MTNITALNAVLWDMDGVLVDTFEPHFQSWRLTFETLGHTLTLEEFRKTFGMNNRLILPTILGYELEESDFLRISEQKEALFRQVVRGNVKILPGVLDWLERFKQLGLKQAVASSGPLINLEVLLEEMGIEDRFDAVTSGATLKGKPDPAVFLLAAEQLGVKPESCLVIEDAVAGVEAARRAGMKCVAVLTTNPAEKLADADVIVRNMEHFTGEMLSFLFDG